MATLTQLVSALSTFPNSTNLKNRSDNVAVPLGIINNSANDYPNAKLLIDLRLGTTCRPGGTIDLYMMSCIETQGNSSNWTDGISPSTAGSVTTAINNATLIKSLKAGPSMTTQEGGPGRTQWVCNDLAAEVGKMPPFWTLLVVNNSGSTLGTTPVTKYSLVSYQSA
jgi:hypothetical protein